METITKVLLALAAIFVFIFPFYWYLNPDTVDFFVATAITKPSSRNRVA